ncbi:hypothetical protein [Flavobacterium gyeonganense]|uniref:Uncharacterized protein n=1 Tax=Flavobacterium gyeonganense TaxID=1310418 RepID=A0ABV5HB47_9FLAO|nr:hypothetical protein [Flavobacterium gyeonganense]
MMRRINVGRIIFDHFKTLRSLNQSYNFMNIGDIFLFLILPLILAITTTLNGYNFQNHLTDLIATISILGGFLFNLLVVIYSQIDNIRSDLNISDSNDYEAIIKNKFVNEIHSNISFAIVLSLFLLITLLSTTIDIPEIFPQKITKLFLIFVNYFLMCLFSLTLLMIISRIYVLFKKNRIQ